MLEIVGLALPYATFSQHPQRLDLVADGRLVQSDDALPLGFHFGCCANAIRAGQIEIVVDNTWVEHLASQRHGLTLWETAAGLFYRASLPATPFATSLVAEIKRRPVGCCARSSSTQSERQDDNRLIVYQADVIELSLMVNGRPTFPETWTAVAGPAAEARITREMDRARARHWPTLARA